jgi:ABC-type dipeptide/oligopeptide/nickel transport system permease component
VSWLTYLLRRIGLAVIQVVIIEVLTFVILRVIPANPAYRIAGFDTSPQHIAEIKAELGLNKPIWAQLWDYTVGVMHGQLGTSLSTGDSVWQDLEQRVPATLELVVIGLGVAILIGVPLGIWSARRRSGPASRIVRLYSLLAGSQPDYWWGLALVFIFFVVLKIVPGPVGQLGVGVTPPNHVTGSYLLDSLLTGNWATLRVVLSQLVLPIATVVIVYMAPILKMTASSYRDAMRADCVRLLRASGVSEFRIALITLRLAAQPIVTTIGICSVFLLGGAALIETVFGWNGAAQYAVSAAVNSDYPGMQGVVLAIAVLAALFYLLTDVVQMLLDPRVRSGRAE